MDNSVHAESSYKDQVSTDKQEMKAKTRKTSKEMDNCDKAFEVSIFNILILAKMFIMKKISDMLIYAVHQGCKRLILDNVLRYRHMQK